MTSGDKEKYQIKDVWANNLEEEMAILRGLVEKYPYISMVNLIVLLSHILFFFLKKLNFIIYRFYFIDF